MHVWLDSTGGVREARLEDLPALAHLCAEHAKYERATFLRHGAVEQWTAAIFAAPRRLRVWVVEADAQLVGYASAAPEYSTWGVGDYLHMDCLFVRANHRGRGVGAELLQAVFAAARAEGFAQVQWQTPQWNAEAIRFYSRHGAVSVPKCRFVLPLR
jgi:GNAT superfamily N-acetyltransferase